MDSFVEILKTVLIALVEGITEWLPVSSTGHMILLDEFIRLNVSEDFWNMFLVVIQLGAILAVCVLYFSYLNPFSRKKTVSERKETGITWAKIIVGVIPAALIGLPLNDWMEEHLYNSLVVACALIVYGIAFIGIEKVRSRNGRCAHYESREDISSMEELSFGKAFGIGCFQVLSLVPGTSRSGSTIIGALLLGTSRTLAAEFSFFMAIPVMVGASGLKLVKYFLHAASMSSYELLILFVGLLVAFLTSILSIRFLLRFVRTRDFCAFGVYRIILGLFVIAYFSLMA